MRFRTLERCYMFGDSLGPSKLLYVSTKLGTLELCYMFGDSSGPSSCAVLFNHGQDTWTWPSGSIQIATCLETVGDSRTVLHVWRQFRTLEVAVRFNEVGTLELCYMFGDSSGPSNLMYVSTEFGTLELCYMFGDSSEPENLPVCASVPSNLISF